MSKSPAPTSPRATTKAVSDNFSEMAAWRAVGKGWQPLFAGFRGEGFSIEWHDFMAKGELDWAASFHPEAVELCLNLEGHGHVESPSGRVEFVPGTVGFYHRGSEPVAARRAEGQRHRFLTVEYSRSFLAENLSDMGPILHPLVRAALGGGEGKMPSAGASTRLTSGQAQMTDTLRHPPVYSQAQPLWYRCKALELAVTFFLQPQPEQELFCTRQERLAQERVEQVILLLRQNPAEPPSLEEMGRKIGCSHFYLSRTFSARTGRTIMQHLRQLRMERAAELLKAGELNVTEVALEVGYSSISHFSTAFHETFGCCPGLFPIQTPAQKHD